MFQKVETVGLGVTLLVATYAAGGHTGDLRVLILIELLALGAVAVGISLLRARPTQRRAIVEYKAFGTCLVWLGISCAVLLGISSLNEIDPRWFADAVGGIAGIALLLVLVPLARLRTAP